ncbi:LOW QUALITY PROTEIN: carbohydrate sulfotransferase 15-like, partial [Lampetra planeri]
MFIHFLSLTKLQYISKVKAVSFLLGLILMFIVISSYILGWDKRGPLLPPPHQLRSDATSTNATGVEVCSEEDLLDMKVGLKLIDSSLEYPPRKVPDIKEITAAAPDLFRVFPRQFLRDIKSPCWYEEISGDPYEKNSFRMEDRVRKNLRTEFTQNLHHQDGKVLRLRCLPYFYLIGQPKCGTTDLFKRLKLHPDLRFNLIKEPHWWTRRRIGWKTNGIQQKRMPLDVYLDVYVQVTVTVLTGDFSASTMWDNLGCTYRPDYLKEPSVLVQDIIHTVQPNAKIIVMFRDPTDRLYSDYLYFTERSKSAKIFHLKVIQSIQLFQSCLLETSLRSCVYNRSLHKSLPVRLSLGLYSVFLLDWLTVFPREQILVIRMEDYAANLKMVLRKTFDFLSLDPLSAQQEVEMINQEKANTRQEKDKNKGLMLPATRKLLRDFYRPFNEKLASVLGDRTFLWS